MMGILITEQVGGRITHRHITSAEYHAEERAYWHERELREELEKSHLHG